MKHAIARLSGPTPRAGTAGRHWIFLPLALLIGATVVADGQSKSQVIKKNRPPPSPPIIQPADNVYRIWTTFELTRKANNGDVIAQHTLGLRYLFGQGAAADTVRAALWIMKAAQQDYMPACFNYGILCYHGWGVEWDPFEAFGQFRKCARQGMVEAEYAMVQFLTENLVVPRDYEGAYAWAKLAADSGYAPAKAAVVRFEKLGLGGARADSIRPRKSAAPNTGLVFLDFAADTITATNDTLLLREAIQSADPSTRRSLGLPAIPEEGARWTDSTTIGELHSAADAGSPEALTLLGRAAEKGIGVRRDPVKACAFYIRAVRVDGARAPELLVNFLQQPAVLKEIRSRAEHGSEEAEYVWAGLAALGFDGILAQGQAYITGDQALRLLRQSGGKKYLPAIVEEGLCFYSGKWVAESRETALAIWNKAASLGSKDARIRLALVALRSGGPVDGVREALSVLQAAAEEGSVLGEMGMGYAYETGSGVAPRKALAASYYREASVRGSQDAFRALRRMHDAIRPQVAEFHMTD